MFSGKSHHNVFMWFFTEDIFPQKGDFWSIWLLSVGPLKPSKHCCILELSYQMNVFCEIIAKITISSMLLLCSFFFKGIPKQLRQRHAQKEHDRSTHLRSAHPDPPLVMVRQDHFARRDTRMHRGRVKPFPPSILAIASPRPRPCPPVPLAYWSITPSISKINCATCKKEVNFQWIFQEYVFGCGGLLFVLLYNDFKTCPLSTSVL